MIGPLNRARNQLWKERDKKGKRREIFCGLKFAKINVKSITHGLERIKGNSHRQNNIKDSGVNRNSYDTQKRLQPRGKKIEVFKKAKYQQIAEYADEKKVFSFPWMIGAVNKNAADKVNDRGNKDQ